MRDVLFRGKEITTAKWVYGGYYGDSKRAWIRSVVSTEYGREILQYEVDPSTVGQYTGLTDKNGKRIFEGDIVEEFCGVDGHREQGAVYFDDLHLQFLFGDYNSLLKCSVYERKVIGNIYDNPELAKE